MFSNDNIPNFIHLPIINIDSLENLFTDLDIIVLYYF